MLYAKACGVHIGESVLALSFLRNLTVSTNVRTTTAPSPVLVVYSSQTIQVWGLFQSVYARALSEPLGRQTDWLHTFFLHKPADEQEPICTYFNKTSN